MRQSDRLVAINERESASVVCRKEYPRRQKDERCFIFYVERIFLEQDIVFGVVLNSINICRDAISEAPFFIDGSPVHTPSLNTGRSPLRFS